MSKTVLSARVAADVVAAAKERAAADAVSLTDVVERALIEYLGLAAGDRNIAEQVADIEQRLSQLEAATPTKNGRRKGRR